MTTVPTNVLTRSKPFRMLVDKAFAVCDADQTGHVCKTELYAGLLLVHRTYSPSFIIVCEGTPVTSHTYIFCIP